MPSWNLQAVLQAGREGGRCRQRAAENPSHVSHVPGGGAESGWGPGLPLPASPFPVWGQGPLGRNIPLGGKEKWAFTSQTHEMRLYFKNTHDGMLPSGTMKLKRE